MIYLKRLLMTCLLATLVACGGRFAPSTASDGGWSEFGGDKAYTRYAPLDQIGHDNVANLRVLWRRGAVNPDFIASNPDLNVPRNLLSTPQMIDGILYAANGIGLLEAMDPATGRTLWMQAVPPGDTRAGRSNRGIGYWTDGSEHRLLHVRGEYLYALDRETGRVIDDFGDEGRVYLRASGPRALPFSSATGVLVVGDVAVIAGVRGGAGDRSTVKERDPGNIMGYDVRTGELRWTFNVVPQEGEFGADTWGNRSWETAGDMASWCCMSADVERGYIYFPVSSPTGFYGGWRPGDNLFSNSLVAVDARTGERVWHYQMIRHGIWEHEPVGPPILGDITVDGRLIEAVMQPIKTGYVFVFDRVTGEPVWPIEDRPAPRSGIDADQTSPTQPYPTRPAPFDRIGVTADDLIDFTPEIRARTVAFLQQYRLNTDLFTPGAPAITGEPDDVLGMIIVPGTWGAANWNTGAFDPETGMYYAASHTLPGIIAVQQAEDEEMTIGYTRTGDSPFYGPDGLPLVKPPYGRITAIDMNTGNHVWERPNGDAVNEHPLLRDLDLPPLGTPNRPVALVTKTLLFLGEGSDVIGGVREFFGRTFRAYDKATGDVVWETELPGGTTSQPMSYMYRGKQYIVVPIGDSEQPAEWVALGLP